MFESILWILFVLACVLVSAVILLQEGKGGGLSEAFGGAGQQTFGVKAEGINKFTGWVAVAVVILAITITRMRMNNSVVQFADTPAPPPASSSDAGTPAPAGSDTGAPPPAAPATPPTGGGK